jgi:hypothetical protein
MSKPYVLSNITGHIENPNGWGFGGALEHFNSLEDFAQWATDWGVSRAVVFWLQFIVLFGLIAWLVPMFPKMIISWGILLSPLWISYITPWIWTKTWGWYVRVRYLSKKTFVLMEVKMPHEIHKSPAAMEHVLSELWYTSNQTTVVDRFWKGQMRQWSSLEICSFGGSVHFYFWCFKELKDLIELNLYAQYPELEIFEVEDYAKKFVYDPTKMDVFGNHMIYLSDPVQPIRTYHDFELEEVHEPEHIVDPMAQVIETLGALKNSEQGWIQIMFHAMTESDVGPFMHQCEERIEELRKEGALFGPHVTLSETEVRMARARPTWQQTEQMHSIERHMNKRMFEVNIRVCYIANLEDYRGVMRNAIRWIFMPYYGQWQNRLRPKRWHGDFDYSWQDFKQIRWRLTSRRLFDAWKRRSAFYAPWVMTALPMSSEAIASLWHPPSSGIATPGLERLHAKKIEAPHNLPR